MQQILTWLCFAAVMMRELESGMRKFSHTEHQRSANAISGSIREGLLS